MGLWCRCCVDTRRRVFQTGGMDKPRVRRRGGERERGRRGGREGGERERKRGRGREREREEGREKRGWGEGGLKKH